MKIQAYIAIAVIGVIAAFLVGIQVAPGRTSDAPIYHVIETSSTSTAAAVKYDIHTLVNQTHDKLVVSLSGSDGSLTSDSVLIGGGVTADTSSPPLMYVATTPRSVKL